MGQKKQPDNVCTTDNTYFNCFALQGSNLCIYSQVYQQSELKSNGFYLNTILSSYGSTMSQVRSSTQ
jgi:hypothetical protein